MKRKVWLARGVFSSETVGGGIPQRSDGLGEAGAYVEQQEEETEPRSAVGVELTKGPQRNLATLCDLTNSVIIYYLIFTYTVM